MTIQNAKGADLTISVSSRETWDLCPRKWYYAYYMRLDQPETEALAIGNAVHGLLETRLRDKVWTIDDPMHWYRRLAEAALKASDINPDEHTWTVEKWLDKVPCGPLTLVGKVDLYRVENGRLQVWDWKTCGGPRFALDEEMLRRHHQPLLYGYALSNEHGLKTPFDVRYIYVDKKTANAWPVDAPSVTYEDAAQRFNAFASVAEDMARIATDQPRADAVAANPQACRKYGTLCAFASFCSAAPQARIPQAFQSPHVVPVFDPRSLTPMSTTQLSGLAALAAAAGVPPTASSPAPTLAAKPPVHTGLAALAAAAGFPPTASSPAPTLAAKPPVRTGPPAIDDPVGACSAQVEALLGLPAYAAGVPEATVMAMAKGMGARLADVIEKVGLEMWEGRLRRPLAAAQPSPPKPAAPKAGSPLDSLTPEALEVGLAAGMVMRFGLLVAAEDAGLDVAAVYAKYHGADEVVAAATAIIAAVEGRDLPPVAEPSPPIVEEKPPVVVEKPAAPPPAEKLDRDAEVAMAADWLKKQTWRQNHTTVSALRVAFLDLLPGRKRLGPTFVADAVAASGFMTIADDGETVNFRIDAAVADPSPAAPVETVTPVVEAAPAVTPPAPEPPAPVAVPAPAGPFPAPTGVLFVNIVVERGNDLPLFADWARTLEPQVIEHAKSVGLKGTEYGHYGLIEYGKGVALMEVAIRGALKAGAAPLMMTLDMSHPMAHIMLAAAHATPGYVVYRGVQR